MRTPQLTLVTMLTAMVSCGGTASEEVVVYTSVDDVFARPVAEDFEQATGILVRLVPDTEETKSTGLVNRLLAERARPRVLIYNRALVPDDAEPSSIMDLLEPHFQGQACIANPLFGTTSMHAAALFEVLGAEQARGFFERFVDNGGRILSSQRRRATPSRRRRLCRRSHGHGRCQRGVAGGETRRRRVSRRGDDRDLDHPERGGPRCGRTQCCQRATIH